MENGGTPQPTAAKDHHSDALATKFVDKTGQLQEKAAAKKPGDGHKGPAGGFDSTPLPQKPSGYTVKFTFHRATNLPMADVNSLSSDPYVLAQLNTSLLSRHKQDPCLRFRSKTIRRNTEPEWNVDWIVANVPADGFKLKVRVYDEDPADHDDRLGDVHVTVNSINESWPGIQEQAFDIKKRKGSKRAYLVRGCAAMFSKGLHMSGDLIVSAQVLGRSDFGGGGKAFTVGPCNWSQHLSPLIGRLAGTKDPEKGNDQKTTEKYNFQANQFQFSGPVPSELYHRYVEFKPFVAGMFTSHSLRGRVLNRTLHHQHSRIYNYDRTTVYGSFPSPSKQMTSQFLDLVHWDQGGRIYTYILTLDGQLRFTETGKEFGIDMLSKHTMHSDVSIYIAFSGEFFIRRLSKPWKDPDEQETHPPTEIGGGPPTEGPPKDPSHYQLTIDNDSGTYRPNPELLALLKEFFHRNLPGLKISTLDCTKDEEKMGKLKGEQRERKKHEGGGPAAFVQGDSGSISSSDEEDLAATEGEVTGKNSGGQKGTSVEEPKNKIKGWVKGGNAQREAREEDDDIAAARDKEEMEKQEGVQPQHEAVNPLSEETDRVEKDPISPVSQGKDKRWSKRLSRELGKPKEWKRQSDSLAQEELMRLASKGDSPSQYNFGDEERERAKDEKIRAQERQMYSPEQQELFQAQEQEIIRSQDANRVRQEEQKRTEAQQEERLRAHEQERARKSQEEEQARQSAELKRRQQAGNKDKRWSKRLSGGLQKPMEWKRQSDALAQDELMRLASKKDTIYGPTHEEEHEKETGEASTFPVGP